MVGNIRHPICFIPKGKGVFATREFKNGDFFLQYKGKLISAKEGEQCEKEYSSEQGSFLYFFSGKELPSGELNSQENVATQFKQTKTIIFQIHCRSLMIQYFWVLDRDKIVGVFISMEFNLRLMHAYLLPILAKNLGNFNFKQEKYPPKI